MTESFNQQFDQHVAWRHDVAEQLHELRDWLWAQDLLDAAVQEHLQRLQAQLCSDKITVAFVAEFSRGKSELINAVFFADYGRRLMPASAGRTTMCPVELGWEEGLAPSLRLLPIQTREQPLSLEQWRMQAEAWQQLPLDVENSAQIAATLAKVSEVCRVPVAQARAWGLWLDEAHADNPALDAQGLVEVPMWRHALVNLPHSLLRQGLVIVDTPGLNAVGAEPELSVNLIPQAHAVVFLLGADTGVTQSDLDIWRDHVRSMDPADTSRLVVLNKIDTLWDSLSSGREVHAQLQRQRSSTAQTLDIEQQQVLLVSAQKGLVAKINDNAALLQASGLQDFEQALSQNILGRKNAVLRAAAATAVEQLHAEVVRKLNIRHRDLDDQMAELRSLRGKNSSVIESMRARIEQERAEFSASTARIQALRAVHARLLQALLLSLAEPALQAQLAGLREILLTGGLKLGVNKAYARSFAQLRAVVQKVRTEADELQQMLTATFRELNAEFGFSLQAIAALPLEELAQELAKVERDYLRYLGLGHALQLARTGHAQRLLQALTQRLAAVFGGTGETIRLWSQAAISQLDAQWAERKRSFTRRIEAVDRIQQAAGSLVERIAEIEAADRQNAALALEFAQFSEQLLALSAPQIASPTVI